MKEHQFKRSERSKLLISLVTTRSEDETAGLLNGLSLNGITGLGEAAFIHGLAPLLYRRLLQFERLNLLPGELQERLRINYLKTIADNTRLIHAWKEILQKAAETNLHVVTLKGIALLAKVYEDPGLRPMNDMDLLVSVSDFKPMKELLTGLGYHEARLFEGQAAADLGNLADKGWTVFQKGPVLVDLHSRINIGMGERHISSEDVMQNSERCVFQHQDMTCLSPSGILQHLIVHLDKHLQKGITRYSNLVDIILFLRLNRDVLEMDRQKWMEFSTLYGALPNERLICDWLFLISRKFKMNLLLSSPQPSGSSDLDRKLEKWMWKGDRRERPVIPPWERPQYHHAAQMGERLRYSWSVFFPGMQYMQKAYGISNRFLLLFYYPYRIILHTSRYFRIKLRRD